MESDRGEAVVELEARLRTAGAVEWLARLAAVGVPSGRIRTVDEVYAWEQTRSQGLLIDVEHPTLGTVQLPGPPVRLEGLDGTGTARRTYTAPPLLGQHDATVAASLDGS